MISLTRCSHIRTGRAILSLLGLVAAGARLVRANLSGLNLMDENFCLTNLDGADLTGSDLSGAKWVNCRPCLPGSIGMCIQEPL